MKFAASLNLKRHQFFFTHPVNYLARIPQGMHIIQKEFLRVSVLEFLRVCQLYERNSSGLLYRVSQKKLMPFQIQISREFHYGTLSIPIGIQRTDRD